MQVHEPDTHMSGTADVMCSAPAKPVESCADEGTKQALRYVTQAR